MRTHRDTREAALEAANVRMQAHSKVAVRDLQTGVTTEIKQPKGA